MTIYASDPDMVYVRGGYTGMDWTYGEVWLTSYVDYYMRTGKTLDEVKTEHPELFGKMVDNVITFPARSFLISMDNYNDGGLYNANTNGMLAIALPGGVIADYAVAASYLGKFVNADGSEEIKAGGMFGEDIASAKAFLVQDKLTSEALTAILSGETEGYDMELAEIEDDDYTFGGSAFMTLMVKHKNMTILSSSTRTRTTVLLHSLHGLLVTTPTHCSSLKPMMKAMNSLMWMQILTSCAVTATPTVSRLNTGVMT